MKTSKKQFEQKLIQLQQNMFNFALTLTNNWEEAEDLTQETTLKALDSRDKFHDNVNFKGWVLTIMRNLFINNYRRVVRSQMMFSRADNLYQIEASHTFGEENPENAYNCSEIKKVLESFEEGYKKPFMMHMSGYMYKEIAESMQLPIGTVKSRIFFVRQRSQELLKDFR